MSFDELASSVPLRLRAVCCPRVQREWQRLVPQRVVSPYEVLGDAFKKCCILWPL